MPSSRYQTGKKVALQLSENLAQIRILMAESLDLTLREFELGNGQRAATLYIDGLVDMEVLGHDFYAPLQSADNAKNYSAAELSQRVISLGSLQVSQDFDQVIGAVLQGLTALFVDGDDHALLVQAISWQQRSVAEPGTDVVIRGPREGFIESMRVNVSLLRRKIHHPDFTAETLNLGRYSRTDIALVYIKGIVNQDVLTRLRQRLSEIDIDAILDSGYIEQLVQDTPYSLFPTIGTAEKPDIAAARILEGRIAILVDGSPVALTVPMLFVEGLHSPEDHYTRFYYATWVRIIRAIAFAISLLLPGFFLAAVYYHQQIIPFNLLLSMAAGESSTPFSTGFSLLLLGLAYEILREAGIRLPKPAGQAISIVGAIVMGDAAVSANLISASVLIVLALTVVAAFVSATYVDAATLLRLIFLLLAWGLGFFGMLIGILFLLVYLCSLESFGVPFFAPFAPYDAYGMRDAMVRYPLRRLRFRPDLLSRNRRRMGQTPKTSADSGEKG